MTIALSKEAGRALRRMPRNLAAIIRGKIGQLAENQASLANNIKALKGEPSVFRLRGGDWRIVHSVEGNTITIISIAPRGSAYD